jgi:hypothetical protein
VDSLLVGTSIMQSRDVIETMQSFILAAESSLKSHPKSKSRLKARSRSNPKQGDGSFEQFA